MAHRSLTVGTVQVTAFCDVTGDFPAPLDQAFPQVPAAAWAPWRSRHPGAFSGTDGWRLRDWCFVVRARHRVVLVVLTHLHLDHIGWNLAWDGERPRPLFPRARYLVQRADWELFASRPPLGGPLMTAALATEVASRVGALDEVRICSAPPVRGAGTAPPRTLSPALQP